MAEVAYTVRNVNSGVRLVSWTPLTNGDTGQWYRADHLTDASFHAFGTAGSGGTLICQGSNEAGTPSNAVTVTNPGDTNISMTAFPDSEQVLNNMYQYRPNVTAGDGSTSLTVIMKFSTTLSHWRKRE